MTGRSRGGWVLALGALACASRAPIEEAQPMTPPTQRAFAEGPSLRPSAALLAFLEGDAKGRRVRLPVVLDAGPLGIATAHIGTGDEPDEDTVWIALDDAALGIGVADRVRTLCVGDAKCVIWLEGLWGTTLRGPHPALPGADASLHPFSVRAVVGLVAPDDEARVYVAASLTEPTGEAR